MRDPLRLDVGHNFGDSIKHTNEPTDTPPSYYLKTPNDFEGVDGEPRQ